MQNLWIWQHPNYPNFSFDRREIDTIIKKLEQNHEILKEITNKINRNDLLKAQISALEDEIISSSLIEGERLNRSSIRSSVKKRLDENFDWLADTYATRHSDNLVSLMLDANLNKAPMNFERLHGWHNALFEYSQSKAYKIKRAKFRDDEMSVVSAPSKNVQIHYEALPAKRVENETRNFLNFINKNHENAYVKSALAHLWFVIIHPYNDGNGRMARALAHYCLAGKSIEPFSISSVIYANKKDYYEILEQTTKLENNLNFDFTAWIKRHLEAVNSAINKL
ncbi:DUF4172 domain-containing protein [Campylobacter concisus]|uniref:Fic family protein n=1 Tax=Campylobacter concisus TaxID=199 RepID=UPI001CE44E51|nr:DUF4172 domain-containing protein [Campylobacter concisus]MCA6130159.1 DUF4172 domain-containing protein [Campylobacter concisus]MCA6132215.1 DUF4172 domain-containing protein [Campylobacter concisus]